MPCPHVGAAAARAISERARAFLMPRLRRLDALMLEPDDYADAAVTPDAAARAYDIFADAVYANAIEYAAR